MRKGFTLLELVVVIIIIGVLATLGIQQYAKMIERARGAEARSILGQMRGSAAARRLETGTLTGLTAIQLGIGAPAMDRIPATCAQTTHFFSYALTAAAGNTMTLTATRCLGGAGKVPGGTTAGTLTLVINFLTGADVWGGTGGY